MTYDELMNYLTRDNLTEAEDFPANPEDAGAHAGYHGTHIWNRLCTLAETWPNLPQ